MATKPITTEEMDARYQARLEQEVIRLREQSRRAVEEFKKSFPPPSDKQIERLLYPELSEFAVELGGHQFTLRELPALVEKKFLRLVEQKLPSLVDEILSFDHRLGDEPAGAFTHLLGHAGAAIDLVADACLLVLDPDGSAGVTREFLQQHASTSRQLRILQAQLLLNGGRDFLSRLFPALSPAQRNDEAATHVTPDSPPPSVGWSSSASPPEPSRESSPSANSP